MADVFGERATVAAWLEVESALAGAQADLGILSRADADAIAAACDPDAIDLDARWREASVVGYPILPLVRAVVARLPDGPNGRVHYGATTQDIMDTGLALQLRAALDRLEELVAAFGDGLAEHAAAHRDTVVAGRTHAQQAVPTTFGAKLATFLAELARHRDRLRQGRERICVVSLYGAGGTAAALGPSSAEVRSLVARRLELHDDAVPWHVTRDALAEFGFLCAALAATCARFAGEVIALSRTEIDELVEGVGHHRGASSTMPQKANPILSEGIIGLAATTQGLVAPLLRAMEAGHERAAGEWQIEWEALPQVAVLAAGALATAARVAREMHPKVEVMRANLGADSGLVLAEAYMMALAPTLGREDAHDLVYVAARDARERGLALHDAVRAHLDDRSLVAVDPIHPGDYLGEAPRVCDAALARWRDGA
jgi:3-carboxy-cis,cis-muconate cycloisomerase